MNITPAKLRQQYERAVKEWPFFHEIERAHGLLRFQLFATGSKETNLNPEYTQGKLHADGHGHGLFGMDDRWHDIPEGFDTDPRMQAEAAASLLAGLFNEWDSWEAAIDRYGPQGGIPAYRIDVLERRNYLASIYGGPLETWHPRATRVEPANTSAGSYRVDCAWKFVLHTVEGYGYSPSRDSYYGSQSYPHFTLNEAGIYQHFPIDAAARALYNEAGGVETNAARAIQVEIVWFAGQIADLPDVTMANLADLTGWLVGQDLIPLNFAEFRGDGSYGVDAPQRFTGDEWYAFAGICGHQHVPENDHWDPGDFPTDRLLAALGADEEDDLNAEEKKALFAQLQAIYDNVNDLGGGVFARLGNGNWEEGAARLARAVELIEKFAQSPMAKTYTVTGKLDLK